MRTQRKPCRHVPKGGGESRSEPRAVNQFLFFLSLGLFLIFYCACFHVGLVGGGNKEMPMSLRNRFFIEINALCNLLKANL